MAHHSQSKVQIDDTCSQEWKHILEEEENDFNGNDLNLDLDYVRSNDSR